MWKLWIACSPNNSPDFSTEQWENIYDVFSVQFFPYSWYCFIHSYNCDYFLLLFILSSSSPATCVHLYSHWRHIHIYRRSFFVQRREKKPFLAPQPFCGNAFNQCGLHSKSPCVSARACREAYYNPCTAHHLKDYTLKHIVIVLSSVAFLLATRTVLQSHCGSACECVRCHCYCHWYGQIVVLFCNCLLDAVHVLVTLLHASLYALRPV